MQKEAYAQEIYSAHPAKGSILHLKIEEIYAEKAEEGRLGRNESIRLAKSIQKYGLSTPLIVTPVEAFPGFYRYRVLKGAEIWRAAGIAGLQKLPCIISDEPPQDPQITSIFAEFRAKRLHIFEQAAAIEHLSKMHGLSRAEIARGTGLSLSAVANKLRLLRLLPAERHEILRAGLTERHARALLRLSDPQKRAVALQKIHQEHLSVAAAEALIERLFAAEEAQPCECSPVGAETQADAPVTAKQAQICEDAPTQVAQSGNAEAPISSTPMRKIPAAKPPTGNICPKKFVLHSLQPLYNSLERTLGIFRKTGRGAEMSTQEGEDGILITIRIPAAN